MIVYCAVALLEHHSTWGKRELDVVLPVKGDWPVWGLYATWGTIATDYGDWPVRGYKGDRPMWGPCLLITFSVWDC